MGFDISQIKFGYPVRLTSLNRYGIRIENWVTDDPTYVSATISDSIIRLGIIVYKPNEESLQDNNACIIDTLHGGFSPDYNILNFVNSIIHHELLHIISSAYSKTTKTPLNYTADEVASFHNNAYDSEVLTSFIMYLLREFLVRSTPNEDELVTLLKEISKRNHPNTFDKFIRTNYVDYGQLYGEIMVKPSTTELLSMMNENVYFVSRELNLPAAGEINIDFARETRYYIQQRLSPDVGANYIITYWMEVTKSLYESCEDDIPKVSLDLSAEDFQNIRNINEYLDRQVNNNIDYVLLIKLINETLLPETKIGSVKTCYIVPKVYSSKFSPTRPAICGMYIDRIYRHFRDIVADEVLKENGYKLTIDWTINERRYTIEKI